jgi:hypothetical protein
MVEQAELRYSPDSPVADSRWPYYDLNPPTHSNQPTHRRVKIPMPQEGQNSDAVDIVAPMPFFRKVSAHADTES